MFSCSPTNLVTQNRLANPKNTPVKASWCIRGILVFSSSPEKVEDFMYQEIDADTVRKMSGHYYSERGWNKLLSKKIPNYPLNLSFVISFTS